MAIKILFVISICLSFFVSGCDTEEPGSNSISNRNFALKNIYWTNRTDKDGDGYSSYGSLHVIVEGGDFASHDVRIRLYMKAANETAWTWLEDRRVYRSGDVTYGGLGSRLYYGLYDFRVLITAWQPNGFEFYDDILPEDNPALNNQKFEYNAEDLRYEP